MASVYRDCKGKIFVDFLENDKTITGTYTSLMKRVKDDSQKNRPRVAYHNKAVLVVILMIQLFHDTKNSLRERDFLQT